MSLERHFLNWDAPLTQRVSGFLLPPEISGPVDLGNDLIIVPTRQAGRRLREALAQHCAERNTALLPPHVDTPGDFLRRGKKQANAASKTEVAAVWADILTQADLKRFNGLFPARTPRQDFSWALHTGQTIQRLRDALADGEYRIKDVYQEFGSMLEEVERWRDLAELEAAYLERLAGLGKQDPIDLLIEQAERPYVPSGIKRTIIAAVPDPTPLMIRALQNLAEEVSIVILIHAPESLADHFDDWGRPLLDRWQDSWIDIPSPDENIILAGSPTAQSQKVLEIIASEEGRFGPADIAVGVPDNCVTPFLAADLDDKGLIPFDPAGKPVTQHPLFQLLDSFRALVGEGDYKAFSAFLRHADVLQRLNIPPHQLLEELDRFQNQHLPLGWDYIASRLASRATQVEFENLGKAVTFISGLVENFERGDLDGAVRSVLQTIYEVRSIDPSKADDEEFMAVAKIIDAALREFEGKPICSLGFGKREALTLLLQRLSEQRYYIEREQALIDLEGWLELPWNDAPFLIITGMNEGIVPSSRLSDVFLPDSLRSQLNLPSDAERLATDIYLMHQLIESHKREGRICFIAGKMSSGGDPLKPSRLLFRCDDAQLLQRAERLFGDPSEWRENYPPTISFLLKVGAGVGAGLKPVPTISVTQMKDYLACPFRFYLKHILSMEPLDDQKTELDAMDFGSLVHHALHQMAKDNHMRRCENESELGDFLSAEASRWVKERFGSSPPLQVEIQLHAAVQRLSAAANVQAELIREGWEIQDSERRGEMTLNGMKISGRIDRVDRHRETGRIRILDYKTSEKAQNPEAVHLISASADARDYARAFIKGKEKRWSDLQLPLYRLMLPDNLAGPVEFGYFNLPKAITQTGITLWDNFTDKLLESAKACAEGIIEDIKSQRFWPPAARVPHDDFEALFPASAADCVEFDL